PAFPRQPGETSAHPEGQAAGGPGRQSPAPMDDRLAAEHGDAAPMAVSAHCRAARHAGLRADGRARPQPVRLSVAAGARTPGRLGPLAEVAQARVIETSPRAPRTLG